MDEELLWVGLDAGAEVSRLCVVGEAGAIRREITVASTAGDVHAALSDLDRNAIQRIAIEAGGCAIPLTSRLRDLGYPVVVFETRQCSKFLKIRQNKTDSNDARGLADIARHGETVQQVHVKTPECQQIRSLLAMRNNLVRQREAGENGIRSLLMMNGGHLRRVKSAKSLRSIVDEEMLRLRTEGVDLSREIGPMLELCAGIRKYVEGQDRELEERARAHPVCSRLMSVPGVGPICSLSFYSAIGDPDRFQPASQVGAYLGLVPCVHQSGKAMRRRGISKMGNRLTRSHLVNAATVLLRVSRQESSLRSWGIALAERVGGHKARVALARKLSIVLLAIWKSGGVFIPEGLKTHSRA